MALQNFRFQTGFQSPISRNLFVLTAATFALFCVGCYKTAIDHERWGRETNPGSWFSFEDGWLALGIKMHLWCVIPAGILMPLQFLPVIRQKYKRFHRWNGRLVTLLLLVGSTCSVAISQEIQGGAIDSQMICAALWVLIILSTTKAMLAIWAKRIDEHRRWMIRCWAWTGSILTMRPILVTMAILYSYYQPTRYKTAMSCNKILYTYQFQNVSLSRALEYYPTCSNTSFSTLKTLPIAEQTWVVVTALFSFDETKETWRPEQMAALIQLIFGAAFWVGLLVNVLCCEWYFWSVEGRKKPVGRAVDVKSVGESVGGGKA